MTTKMRAAVKGFFVLFMLVMGLSVFAVSAHAAEETANKETEATEETMEEASADANVGSKAIAAALVVGFAAAAGAFSMGTAISKSAEGISRQPEAAGDIRGSMMLGLVFIETAIIYALIVAILIIFVM